jgi:hypothetical protein
MNRRKKRTSSKKSAFFLCYCNIHIYGQEAVAGPCDPADIAAHSAGPPAAYQHRVHFLPEGLEIRLGFKLQAESAAVGTGREERSLGIGSPILSRGEVAPFRAW